MISAADVGRPTRAALRIPKRTPLRITIRPSGSGAGRNERSADETGGAGANGRLGGAAPTSGRTIVNITQIERGKVLRCDVAAVCDIMCIIIGTR